MPKLIEVQREQFGFAAHRMAVGDLLFFHATGGQVRSGSEIMELIGSFVTAVVGTEGQILEPLGPPNAVLFRALSPGEAEISVFAGDPFHNPTMTEFRISIRA
jgi:hypothetical protein